MDHDEFCCIFDAAQYTGTPDTAPCPAALDVPAVIRALDALYETGREAEAGRFLEDKLAVFEVGLGDRISFVGDLVSVDAGTAALYGAVGFACRRLEAGFLEKLSESHAFAFE